MFNKDDVKEEHIETAYELLKSYCDENNKDMLSFVRNKSNIAEASEQIHKKLNFAMRLILKPAKIEAMITDNHGWIISKIEEQALKKS